MKTSTAILAGLLVVSLAIAGRLTWAQQFNDTAYTATAATAVTCANSATQAFTATSGICEVSIINASTSVVFVSQTNGVTTANGVPIKVSAVAADGSGGAYTFKKYGGDVYCIVAAGTADVRVQPIACD